jgi:hypothetical protein
VGGLGKYLRAGKTRSQKITRKPRRIPHVHCTLCWATCLPERWQKKDTTTNTTKILHATLIFTRTQKNCNLPKRLLKKDFAKKNRMLILENLILPKMDKANESDKILQTQLTRTFAKKASRF